MSVLVYAPASMANISVGFDTLGAALSPINGELLGDRVQVQASETNTLEISCVGPFADRLPKDPKLNIIYDCYHRFAQKLEQDMQMVMPPVKMTLEKNMPIGSGLGSSACSVVGGFHALNEYMDNPFDEQQLLLLMGELEGQISGSVHYDNVAPCYLGGMQLMLQQDQLISQAIPHFEDWYWVLCYPGINISTAEARSILPAQYRRQDVLSYGRQLAGFVHASYSQQPELAAALLKDVIAEPYRAPLIPGFNQARQYALEQGALAMGISGSGPTVFVACQSQAKAEKIQTWLNQEFIQGPDGFSHLCQIDGLGARKVGTSL